MAISVVFEQQAECIGHAVNYFFEIVGYFFLPDFMLAHQ
jgi:hypothetical protein